MHVRDTPVTFSPDEAHRLRLAMNQGGVLDCPRCDHRLLVGPVAFGDGGCVREWWCPECSRCAMLLDN